MAVILLIKEPPNNKFLSITLSRLNNSKNNCWPSVKDKTAVSKQDFSHNGIENTLRGEWGSIGSLDSTRFRKKKKSQVKPLNVPDSSLCYIKCVKNAKY